MQILIRISDMFSFSTFGWNGYWGKSVDKCFCRWVLYTQFPPSLSLSSSCISDTTRLGTHFAWLCLGNAKFLLVVVLELSSSSEVFSSGAGCFAWDLHCALGFGPVGAAPIQTNGSRYQMGWVIWFVVIQPTFFPQGFRFCEMRSLVTWCQLQKFRHFKTCLLMPDLYSLCLQVHPWWWLLVAAYSRSSWLWWRALCNDGRSGILAPKHGGFTIWLNKERDPK